MFGKCIQLLMLYKEMVTFAWLEATFFRVSRGHSESLEQPRVDIQLDGLLAFSSSVPIRCLFCRWLRSNFLSRSSCGKYNAGKQKGWAVSFKQVDIDVAAWAVF